VLLFDGPPSASPRVIPRGSAGYEPAEPPPDVRHLAGYQGFVRFSAGAGIDPARLSKDLSAIAEVIRVERDAIRSAGVERACAVFLGNVLVAQRRDAGWVRYGEEFPSAGTEAQRYEVLQLLTLLMDAEQDVYEECVRRMLAWAAASPRGQEQGEAP
jgi:hypothetical protein